MLTQDSMHAEFGAWYPRFNNWNMHRPWDRFKNDMTELFDKRLKSTEARVLWRAYGPTHFGGPTGESLSNFPISLGHFIWNEGEQCAMHMVHPRLAALLAGMRIVQSADLKLFFKMTYPLPFITRNCYSQTDVIMVVVLSRVIQVHC